MELYVTFKPPKIPEQPAFEIDSPISEVNPDRKPGPPKEEIRSPIPGLDLPFFCCLPWTMVYSCEKGWYAACNFAEPPYPRKTIDTTSIGADFSDINTVEPYGATPVNGGSPNQQLVSNIGFTGDTSGDVTLKADDGNNSTPVSTPEKRFHKLIDSGSTNVWSASAVGPDGNPPPA